MTQATEVLFPTSADEAVAQYGDGSDVTVIGGGTIVVPEITYGRLAPAKALMLGGAGITGVTRDGARVTIGGATPLRDLVGLGAPVGPCAANVADPEIRAQATARRQPLRRRGTRGTTRRPAGRLARGRRRRPLGRR